MPSEAKESLPVRRSSPGHLFAIALLTILAASAEGGQRPPDRPDEPPPAVLDGFVLGEVEFRGREKIGLAEIEEVSGLKKGEKCDAFRAVESLEAIRRLYRHRGYDSVEVRYAEDHAPGRPLVVVEIVEGPKSDKSAMPAAQGQSERPADAPKPGEFGSHGLFTAKSLPSLEKVGGPEAAPRDPSVQPATTWSVAAPAVDPGRVSEANLHLEWAERDWRAKRWASAIAEASEAVRLVPGVANVYGYRSAIYASMSLPRRAIADLGEAIQLEPAEPSFYLARGYYYCHDRDFGRGFADFDSAFGLSTTDEARAMAHQTRGLGESIRGRHGKAVADFDRALDLGGDHAAVFLARGRALAEEGRHEQAIVDFDRALATNPHAEAWFLRAESWRALGQFDLALVDYEKAIEAGPQNPHIVQGRGWGRLALGRVDEAIGDFNRAIKLANSQLRNVNSSEDLERHRPYTGRGWAYLLKGDLKRASADFDAAIQFQSPELVYFDFGLASRLSFNPIADRAVAEFGSLCRDFPAMPWALIVLQGRDAGSQFLQDPRFAAYFIARPRRDASLAPAFLFRVVAERRKYPQVRSAYFGQAIVATLRWDYRDALDWMRCACEELPESRSPGPSPPR